MTLDLLALVNDVRYNPDAADIPDADLEQLWAWRVEALGVKQASGAVLEAIDTLIAKSLDGAVARFDDYLIKARPRRTLKVYDAAVLFEFLADDVAAAFNPNSVRVSSLKAIAKKRGSDPKAIVDSLVYYEEGEVGLETVPVTKAPKYAAGMEHGEVVRR